VSEFMKTNEIKVNTCPKCESQAVTPESYQYESKRVHFRCDSYGYNDKEKFDLVYRSELCLEREEKNTLQAKLDDLQASTIHSCGDSCSRPMCVLRRERDAYKEALEMIAYDARKVERKLNEALKENARLRPALIGFSQAEELMELREDLRKEQRCSLDLARQNNNLQDYNKKLGQELQDTIQELDEARQEAERYRRKTLSQDAEIAKLKASSNENYWEVSRQRGNMLCALHEISAAVKRGMRQGGIMEGRE